MEQPEDGQNVFQFFEFAFFSPSEFESMRNEMEMSVFCLKFPDAFNLFGISFWMRWKL